MTPTTRCACCWRLCRDRRPARCPRGSRSRSPLRCSRRRSPTACRCAAPRASSARLDEVLSRGVPARLSVDAPRRATPASVLLRQPATPALGVHARRGSARAARRAPRRRAAAATRFPEWPAQASGRCGLARWHHAPGAPAELLVYPDLQTARRLALRLRQGRAAPDGRLRRGPLGLGTDFESIRDYSPDDDIRQVNWRASARLGRPMSNQYRVEQDHDVVCLLDTGRLMSGAACTAARCSTRRSTPTTAVALVGRRARRPLRGDRVRRGHPPRACTRAGSAAGAWCARCSTCSRRSRTRTSSARSCAWAAPAGRSCSCSPT